MRYFIKPIKKIYVLLYYFFLFFLILINKTYAEEKIGYIVSIKNDVYAINIDGENDYWTCMMKSYYKMKFLQMKYPLQRFNTMTTQL